MRSLFLKIFLWFWATAIATGIALILSFILQRGGVPDRWHAALSQAAGIYGRAAVEEMERGGPPAVTAYLEDLSRTARTQACLFDQNGTHISGARCGSFGSLVKRAASSSGHSAFDIRYGLVRVALQISSNNGPTYVF